MAITKDMTTGKPVKLILEFALPLLMGLLFQQVYNIVDSVIVGRVLGVQALAAVGATGSISFLIVGFCLGVCSGFALPIAQEFGAQDFTSLKKYAGNAAVLSAIIAVVLAVITSINCKSILVLMDTPADILDMSYDYIFIIFAGIPATMLYNLLAGYLRSLGDSLSPVIFLVISTVINIFLDFILIVFMGMGVQGAAVATILAQAMSGIMCLIYIANSVPLLHLRKTDYSLSSKYVGRLLYMGIPMGFQYSITAIGSVVLQYSINNISSMAVASITAANKISMFGICPLDALGSTMATYGGQNVGAGQYNRLKKGIRSAIAVGTAYCIFFLAIAYFFGRPLIQLFVDKSETLVISQAYECLLIVVLFYFFLLLVDTFRFMIQGMGYSIIAITAGFLEMIGRALIAIVFVPRYGFIAACFASPLAWIFADAFLVPAFLLCLKHKKTGESSPVL